MLWYMHVPKYVHILEHTGWYMHYVHVPVEAKRSTCMFVQLIHA